MRGQAEEPILYGLMEPFDLAMSFKVTSLSRMTGKICLFSDRRQSLWTLP